MWLSPFKTKALETLFRNIEKLQVKPYIQFIIHLLSTLFHKISIWYILSSFYYSSGCQRQRTTILELSVQFFSRWNRICWWYPLQLCRSSRPRHRPEWYREHNVWCRLIAWSLWRVRNQNTKCRSGTILQYLYFIMYYITSMLYQVKISTLHFICFPFFLGLNKISEFKGVKLYWSGGSKETIRLRRKIILRNDTESRGSRSSTNLILIDKYTNRDQWHSRSASSIP